MSAGETDEAEVRGRKLDWARATLTQGELLDGFAIHCADELDDVEVVAAGPVAVTLRWRRETTQVALRSDVAGACDLQGGPHLLLGPLEDSVVACFLDDADLRGRVAIYDLALLEKVSAVRSSIIVHFEWFLRDAYGVKVVPSEAFTSGLVQRGIISLGMG